MSDETKCARCDGCGKIANSSSGEPWTAWENLPLKSAGAVIMGIVRPIVCPKCKGSGKIDPNIDESKDKTMSNACSLCDQKDEGQVGEYGAVSGS